MCRSGRSVAARCGVEARVASLGCSRWLLVPIPLSLFRIFLTLVCVSFQTTTHIPFSPSSCRPRHRCHGVTLWARKQQSYPAALCPGTDSKAEGGTLSRRACQAESCVGSTGSVDSDRPGETGRLLVVCRVIGGRSGAAGLFPCGIIVDGGRVGRGSEAGGGIQGRWKGNLARRICRCLVPSQSITSAALT